MKFYLSTFLDCLFCFFICFVLFFFFLNYFADKNYAVAVAAAIAITITIAYTERKVKADGQKSMNKTERVQKEKTLAQFNFAKKSEVNDFFQKVLEKQGYKMERTKGGLFLKEKNLAIFPCFGFSTPDKALIVKVFNSVKSTDTAYILSEKFPQDIIDFAARFDRRIILVDGDKVYSYLKNIDCLPPEKHRYYKEKNGQSNFFSNLFKRKKAKSFLAFGLITLAYSYIVPLKVYYVVFGCLFLLAALACFTFGKRRTDDKN